MTRHHHRHRFSLQALRLFQWQRLSRYPSLNALTTLHLPLDEPKLTNLRRLANIPSHNSHILITHPTTPHLSWIQTRPENLL